MHINHSSSRNLRNTSAARARFVTVSAAALALALSLAGCQGSHQQATESASQSASSSTAAARPDTALHTVRLQGADNFRDVAGTDTTYAASAGKRLRPGMVYRSNALHNLTDSDLAHLRDLGVKTVIDLRTHSEIASQPDRVPAGAHYTNVDIMGQGNTAVNPTKAFHVDTPAAAETMLKKANIGFVADPAQRKAFATVLTDIANAPGPVLFHCTAGKDRAGWTTALLQLTAGVSREDVMKNYLATNDYSASSIAATTKTIKAAKGENAAAAYRMLLGVQADYLNAGLDKLDSDYSSIDAYLTHGLGLPEATIQKLRAKLTT